MASTGTMVENLSATKSPGDLITFWILEHALKYRMNRVISEIFTMERADHILKFRNNKEVAYIFPMLFFLYQWCGPDTEAYTSSPDALRHAAIIVRHIYISTNMMKLPLFVNIYLRLSNLAVLCSMRNDDHEKALSFMNELFPVSSTDVDKRWMKDFKLMSRPHLDKFRGTMANSRQCFSRLLSNDEQRLLYFQKYFDRGASLFVGTLSKLFCVFFEGILPQFLPATVIDEFMRGRQFIDGENFSSPHLLQFIARVRLFGENKSHCDTEQLFLKVLSETWSTDSVLPTPQLGDDGLVAKQIASLDTFRTANDESTANLDNPDSSDIFTSPVSTMFTAAETLVGSDSLCNQTADSSSQPFSSTCLTSSPNKHVSIHWTESSSLGLSPQSRKRIGIEFEQFLADGSQNNVSNKPGAECTRIPSANQDVTALAGTSTGKSSEQSSGSNVMVNRNHLPPKKRASKWATEIAPLIPVKRRQRLSISLNEHMMISKHGRSYKIFA